MDLLVVHEGVSRLIWSSDSFWETRLSKLCVKVHQSWGHVWTITSLESHQRVNACERSRESLWRRFTHCTSFVLPLIVVAYLPLPLFSAAAADRSLELIITTQLFFQWMTENRKERKQNRQQRGNINWEIESKRKVVFEHWDRRAEDRQRGLAVYSVGDVKKAKISQQPWNILSEDCSEREGRERWRGRRTRMTND